MAARWVLLDDIRVETVEGGLGGVQVRTASSKEEAREPHVPYLLFYAKVLAGPEVAEGGQGLSTLVEAAEAAEAAEAVEAVEAAEAASAAQLAAIAQADCAQRQSVGAHLWNLSGGYNAAVELLELELRLLELVSGVHGQLALLLKPPGGGGAGEGAAAAAERAVEYKRVGGMKGNLFPDFDTNAKGVLRHGTRESELLHPLVAAATQPLMGGAAARLNKDAEAAAGCIVRIVLLLADFPSGGKCTNPRERATPLFDERRAARAAAALAVSLDLASGAAGVATAALAGSTGGRSDQLYEGLSDLVHAMAPSLATCQMGCPLPGSLRWRDRGSHSPYCRQPRCPRCGMQVSCMSMPHKPATAFKQHEARCNAGLLAQVFAPQAKKAKGKGKGKGRKGRR
jgi:hypothetical protein